MYEFWTNHDPYIETPIRCVRSGPYRYINIRLELAPFRDALIPSDGYRGDEDHLYSDVLI